MAQQDKNKSLLVLATAIIIPCVVLTLCAVLFININENKERVKYNPPRYEYQYDFYVEMGIQNNPYFDEIKFKLIQNLRMNQYIIIIFCKINQEVPSKLNSNLVMNLRGITLA